MSDEIERRLRAAGHHLPEPSAAETGAAREPVLAAKRRSRRRPPLLALAAALVVVAAFGGGYALASGGGKTRVVRERAALDAGPGFLPAASWDVVSSGTQAPVLTATASNRAVGPNGIAIQATFSGTTAKLPERLLPLQLDDATGTGSTRRLRVRVAAWDVDVTVRFGTPNPSAAVLAAAREELGRLVVPACPDAQPLAAGDVEAAKAYLLGWLPAHYPGDARGATATAAAGDAAPRHGQAAADCGVDVARQSVEVDVILPALAKISASLSQLTYFVAKTPDGWVVWERAR